MSRNDISEEQLTAFALDELEGAARDRVALHVASDRAARREVESVRATAALLQEEFANEPPSALLPVQRAELEQRLGARRFPRLRPRWSVVFGAAAAVMLVCGLAYSLIAPSLNRAREVAVRRPDNRLYADGHVEYQDTPFTGMLRTTNGDGSAQAFRDNVYTPGVAQAQNEARQQPGQRKLAQQQQASNGRPGYPGMGMYPGTTPGPATAPSFNLQSAVEPTTGEPAPSATGDAESYSRIIDNGFLPVASKPLSTFSIDVDTASYSNVRRFLTQNALPPKDAVRIEEMVNYFPYAYAPPAADDGAPFAAHIEVAGCPWNAQHRLVRIGLKGKEIDSQHRPASNLVFLIDVSGSMQPDNKLPLVKRGLHMLVSQLNENDRVAIVVYAGSSGLILPSTTGDQKGTILGAIDALGAGGSTNGAGGIERAYQEAVRNFVTKGTNRVILCTDGDFNVGVTSPAALTRLIEDKAKTGVFLSVLGFGMGNLKDATMEKLADKGNGNYAYVDNLTEAHKVLVEQMSGTLVTIAKDVKVQVEFNPAIASAYRLVGYENRILAKEDFNDDTKDAGEIGAGHTVTALYEVVPAGNDAPETRPKVDELKYQKSPASPPPPAGSAELLTVKLRYKEPDGQTSRLLEFPVTDAGATYSKATQDYKFAAAVAAFGMILRDSPHKGTATLAAVSELAQEGLGKDESGYRREFLDLVEKAKPLVRPATGPETDSVLYPKGDTDGQF